jgi:hypothetical protein
MEELLKIRSKIHERVKVLRNIDYFISRPNFENLWVLSTPEQKEALRTAIGSKDKDSVIIWYRNHPFTDIGELSLIQLRETARLLSIHNYSRLSRVELLLAIKSAKECPNNVKEKIKVNYIPEIRKIVDLMIPIMIEATVPEDYFNLPEEVEFFPQELLQEGYEWIEKIYNKEHREAKNIKGLLSEEMWERYRSWADFGDHREVILLTEALQKFRKIVMNAKRPVIFKKSYVKTLIHKVKKEYGV